MPASEQTLERCLVTGASSPLGSALTRLLVSRGLTVGVLVRNASSLPRLAEVRDNIEIIEGTLQDLDIAATQIRHFAAKTVFHLAWQGSGRDARNAGSQIDVNVPGSLKLLNIVLEAGAQCWIGLGSQAEYGMHNGRLREDLAPAPANAYGIAKLCVGQLSSIRCRIAGIRSVWLRLLATYGPADVDGRLIPYLIRTLLAGQNPNLSAGSQRWDYLYIDNAAEALLAAAVSSASGVFNLASGTAWTVSRIASFLRDEINPAAKLEYGAESPVGLEADISRFVEATGWIPRTRLEDGLRRTINWYRAEECEHVRVCAVV